MIKARHHVMASYSFSQCCITFYCSILSSNGNVYGKNTENLYSAQSVSDSHVYVNENFFQDVSQLLCGGMCFVFCCCCCFFLK